MKKILVEVLMELDPTIPLAADRKTGHAKAPDADRLYRVSPICRLGLDQALGTSGATIIAFSHGEGAKAALDFARARGVAKTVVLPCDGGAIDYGLLLGFIGNTKPDLIVGGIWAGMIAAHMGCPHAAGLEAFKVASNNLEAIRLADGGGKEVLDINLPAIIRMDEHIRRRPVYVSQDAISQAAKTAPEIYTSEETNVRFPVSSEAPSYEMAKQRTKGDDLSQVSKSAKGLDRFQALMKKITVKPTKKETKVASGGSTEDMAEEFIRYLQHHGLLQSAVNKS